MHWLDTTLLRQAEMQNSNSIRLSGDLLAALTKKGDVKVYPRDKILIKEGDKSEALYIFVAGQIKVFTRNSTGHEVVHSTFQPGELFGEIFLNGSAPSAAVKATSESQCILIDDERISDLTRAYPELADFLIQSLIVRLRNATHAIKSHLLNVPSNNRAT